MTQENNVKKKKKHHMKSPKDAFSLLNQEAISERKTRRTTCPTWGLVAGLTETSRIIMTMMVAVAVMRRRIVSLAR